MKTVNWGIVGCGNVCERKSGPAMYKTPHSALAAVMRRDAEKVADFARRHNVPKSYTDAAALIANGHAYAASKNMGVNSALTIGNAGYFNPVDLSILSQVSAQSDIYYCIDQIAGMMGAVEQDHPPVYNIVQDGSKIYVLYG